MSHANSIPQYMAEEMHFNNLSYVLVSKVLCTPFGTSFHHVALLCIERSYYGLKIYIEYDFHGKCLNAQFSEEKHTCEALLCASTKMISVVRS